VAIANNYDALATDRVYRKRWLTHEVIEFIRDKNKEAFDPEFVKLFLTNIASFPIGSMVLLNNNEKGIVIKVSKEFAARPVVRVIFDAKGQSLTESIDRNLREDLTLFIIKIFKDDEM
jgi:HD-GYP domain-containing protein (c-di-GMP phosphodiesterase class II)